MNKQSRLSREKRKLQSFAFVLVLKIVWVFVNAIKIMYSMHRAFNAQNDTIIDYAQTIRAR